MTVEAYKLQFILFFFVAKIDGLTRSEAIQGFLDSETVKLLTARQQYFTVGEVYDLAAIAGY